MTGAGTYKLGAQSAPAPHDRGIGRELSLERVVALPPAIRARDAGAVCWCQSLASGGPTFFLSGLPRNLRACVLGRAFYRDGFGFASPRVATSVNFLQREAAKHALQDEAESFESVWIISPVRHLNDDRSPDVWKVRKVLASAGTRYARCG